MKACGRCGKASNRMADKPALVFVYVCPHCGTIEEKLDMSKKPESTPADENLNEGKSVFSHESTNFENTKVETSLDQGKECWRLLEVGEITHKGDEKAIATAFGGVDWAVACPEQNVSHDFYRRRMSTLPAQEEDPSRPFTTRLIATLRKEIEELKEKRWPQPIAFKDRMPEQGQLVLVFRNESNTWNCSRQDAMPWRADCTHWLPMPPAPKVEKSPKERARECIKYIDDNQLGIPQKVMELLLEVAEELKK